MRGGSDFTRLKDSAWERNKAAEAKKGVYKKSMMMMMILRELASLGNSNQIRRDCGLLSIIDRSGVSL